MTTHEERLAIAFERRGLRPNTCLAYRKVIRRFGDYHGRPLWRRLSLGIHRSLWSRIHCRIALEHPRPEDTTEYVQYRLQHAGTKATVFASDALALLHEATAGQLRDIDRISTACLRAAMA